MELNRWVLIAQAINFLIILGLFKWLVWDKIAKNIDERRKELAKAEDAVKVYEETMQQAEEEKKKIIDEAVAHKNTVVKQAEQAAHIKWDKIIADAESRASSIESDAKEKASKLEKDLKDQFVSWVKSTAHAVVKKIFSKDVGLQDEYIVELTKEFAK